MNRRLNLSSNGTAASSRWFERGRGTVVYLLILLTLIFSGCQSVSPIDPSGERLFRENDTSVPAAKKSAANPASSTITSPDSRKKTSGESADNSSKSKSTSWLGSSKASDSSTAPQSQPLISSNREISELTLGPTDPVARIGSQVVLVAGVKDKGGADRSNSMVEWTIEQNSPGGFVDVDQRTWCDIMVGEWEEPRIESSHRAYSSTSRKTVRLTRGTETPSDDTIIKQGQTWVAVSSACEGTTKVSAVALDSADWQHRLRFANIHWIDAWTTLPPTGIAQPINQPLTLQTTAYRADGSPSKGCIVTYEVICSTDNAGFDTSAGRVKNVAIPIDQRGHADVPLIRDEQSPGQTRVRITVDRATEDGKFTVPVRIAQSETVVTWGATGVQVTKTGPLMAAVGEDITYRITVRNTDSQASGQITVTDQFPESFDYQRSLPLGRVLDALTNTGDSGSVQKIQWLLTGLKPGESQTMEVTYRAGKEGMFTLPVTAESGIARAQDSVKIRITGKGEKLDLPAPPAPTASPNPGIKNAPPANIDIKLVCADRAKTGDSIVLRINLTNNGTQTLAQTMSVVAYSSGLSCQYGASPVKLKPVGFIQPNQTREVGLTFKAIAPGRQTFNVEIQTEDGQKFNRQVILTVEGEPIYDENNLPEPVAPQDTPVPASSDAPAANPGNSPAPPATGALDNTGGLLANNVVLRVLAPEQEAVNQPYEIRLEIENRSKESFKDVRLNCFLDSNLKINQFTQTLVTDEQSKPFWPIQELLPQRKYRYILKVYGRVALPTISRFTLSQNNLDLAQQTSQTNIVPAGQIKPGTEIPVLPNSNKPVESTSPDSKPNQNPNQNPPPATNADPFAQLPGIPKNQSEPLPTDGLPGFVDNPPEVKPEKNETPIPELPELNSEASLPTTPEEKEPKESLIDVKMYTRRTALKTNQTFTCTVELTNNSTDPLNAVEVSLFIPQDAFKAVLMGTGGPSRYTVAPDGSVITFAPASVLEPGKSFTYNFRLLPTSSGTTELTATVRAQERNVTPVQEKKTLTIDVK